MRFIRGMKVHFKISDRPDFETTWTVIGVDTKKRTLTLIGQSKDGKQGACIEVGCQHCVPVKQNDAAELQ